MLLVLDVALTIPVLPLYCLFHLTLLCVQFTLFVPFSGPGHYNIRVECFLFF